MRLPGMYNRTRSLKNYMRKMSFRRQNYGLRRVIMPVLAGVMLALWGLAVSPVQAISISPDTLETGMGVLSLSADCAGENLSGNRLVCQDTLTDIAEGHVAGKVADGVVNTGLKQLGKFSGKLGMKTVSHATKGALRALGPSGKVMTSWEFGRMVGTHVSEQWAAPRVEQYLQDKAREERKKIRQQTELLKADKAVADEYRNLLRERGVDEANAYLAKQSSAARDSAESAYDVQKELDRMKELQELAESLDEDEARRRNMEREAQSRELSGGGEHATGVNPGETEGMISAAAGDVSSLEPHEVEEVSEIDDAASSPMTPDADTGGVDEKPASIEDELASFASEQIEQGTWARRDANKHFGSRGGTSSSARQGTLAEHPEGTRRGVSQCDEPGACPGRSARTEAETTSTSRSRDASFCPNLLVRRPELSNEYPPPQCALIVSEMERFGNSVNPNDLSCGDSYGFAIAHQKWSIAANRKCLEIIRNQGINVHEDVLYCIEEHNREMAKAVEQNEEAKRATCPGGSRTWPDPPSDW